MLRLSWSKLGLQKSSYLSAPVNPVNPRPSNGWVLAATKQRVVLSSRGGIKIKTNLGLQSCRFVTGKGDLKTRPVSVTLRKVAGDSTFGSTTHVVSMKKLVDWKRVWGSPSLEVDKISLKGLKSNQVVTTRLWIGNPTRVRQSDVEADWRSTAIACLMAIVSQRWAQTRIWTGNFGPMFVLRPGKTNWTLIDSRLGLPSLSAIYGELDLTVSSGVTSLSFDPYVFCPSTPPGPFPNGKIKCK